MSKSSIHRQRRRRRATNLVRGGLTRSEFGETSEALFLNSGFVYDSAAEAEARFKGEAEGYVYTRYGNPTVTMFEQRMALLEGAEACFGTASGMAAVFAALMCQLKAGDHVVSSRALFGSCFFIVTELLPRYGIETTLVDGPDLGQWRAAMRPGTKAVFFETPSNPTLEIIDMGAVIDLAHAVGASVIVDNVFSTPLQQQPLEYGADIVVYSGTKHIDGQGRCLGGAILSTAEFRQETLLPFVRHTGPALSPFNAWVMLKGLETLELRLDRMCRNAAHLAALLEAHPFVSRVYYPELASHPQHELAMAQMAAGGSVVSFDVSGGKEEAFAVLDSLEIIDISNNLGDTKSLITHPATTTHRAMGEEGRARIGVGDGLVRVSAGLEDIDDLAEDLLLALDAAAKRHAA
ncbi:MAG: O-succinylhomoserine sulfhydrylase [Alphaproteobacteria bacterium]|nr:O-succinylhomoserine sulfhydrylase [Alphaproteobacteria bacterium]